MVLRVIPDHIPPSTAWACRQVLKDVSMTKRGLVILVVGATGSGKSTALAAGMVDYRNQNSYGHIITIEDPVEFVHAAQELHRHAARGGPGHRDWAIAAEEHAAPGPRT